MQDLKEEIRKYGRYKVVKAELYKRGYLLQDIAKELGVSFSTIRAVLSGEGKSKRVARRIEEILEVPLGTIFEYTKEV